MAELLHARTELEKLLNRPDETEFANEALRRVHTELENFERHSQTDKFTNQVKEIAEGILYLTSERLLFCGSENTNVSLKKIVDGQFFSDFLKIDKSTGKSDLFSMNAMEARYILALIRALK
jgi:hypothetical protein